MRSEQIRYALGNMGTRTTTATRTWMHLTTLLLALYTYCVQADGSSSQSKSLFQIGDEMVRAQPSGAVVALILN